MGDQGADDTFVGRAVAVETLLGAWEQARAGAPQLVVVEGPAGIGKTALVREFLRAAGRPRLLWASGDELETLLPFGVLGQLHEGALASPGSQAGEGDPLAAGARLVRLLGELQADRPLAVVVDDAHWADTPSLQALGFAFRRLHAERVLGVVLVRDEPLALPEALRRLAAGDRGAVVELGGLTVDELVALAARLGCVSLPRRGAATLHAHTGGNPLYAAAFLREFGPDALQRTTGPLPPPQMYRRAMLARLARCPPDTEQLITAAAVLGQRCRLLTAARLGEVANPVGALEAGVQAGLLEAAGGAAEIAFSHPLVRAAIYHDLGPQRRCRLHERAAALMEGTAALEHRAAAAVGDDADLAAALATAAREEAARGALTAAAALLDAAARVEPNAHRRHAHEAQAVEMLLRGGEIATALAREERVAGLPDGARRRAALGHIALVSGRQAEAEHLLAGAWEVADPERDAEVAASSAGLLAQLFLAQARGGESATWARRARTVASADAFSQGLAFNALVAALTIQGRGREALSLVAHLPEGVEHLSAEEVEGVFARGVVRLWTADFAGARTDLAAIASLRSGWRPVRVRMISLSYLAVAEFFLGAWDDSVTHADLAVSLAHDTDYGWVFALAHHAASLALAGRGQWDAAQAHAEASRRASKVLGDASGVAYAATAGAWLAHCRSDPQAAYLAVQPVLDLPNRDGIDEPGVLTWQPLYVEALVALGRLDEARAALTPYARCAADRAHPAAMADAARAEALLAAAAGRPDEARQHFDHALQLFEALPIPVERARLAEAYGAFLRRAGERRRAAGLLQSAHDVYATVGAAALLARCGRELAGCGLTPRKRSDDARRRLTPQELAVARLVANGLSNREAARELVISTKTVEYHLGNTYAKLGLRSRTQLAAHMAGP